MPEPIAAIDGSLEWSTAVDGTFAAIDGIDTDSMPKSRAELNGTHYGQSGNHKQSTHGLSDRPVTLSGFWVDGSGTAQRTLRESIVSGGTIWIRRLFDGTNGFIVPVKFFSEDINANVEGRVETTFTGKAQANETLVP